MTDPHFAVALEGWPRLRRWAVYLVRPPRRQVELRAYAAFAPLPKNWWKRLVGHVDAASRFQAERSMRMMGWKGYLHNAGWGAFAD